MKLLFTIFFSFLIINVSYGADKERHRLMAQRLKDYEVPSTSTQPNKAVVYFSSRDNIDDIDLTEVSIDGFDVSDGKIEITRPTSTFDGVTTIQEVTNCQADYGEVEIRVNKLIVQTDRLPVRVRCQNATGEYREFYKTIEKL
jgi:hypothetical protein